MKRQRRNNRTLLLWSGVALILAIVVIIAVFLIPFSYTAKQQRATQEPYDAVEYITVSQPRDVQEPYQDQEPYARKECQQITHQFHVQWIGLFENAGTAVAQLELANQEDHAGNYNVLLAFYDQAYYPDSSNSSVLWSDANMYSEPQTFALEPNERRDITISTPMKNPSTSYWARYQVTPPQYVDCKTVTDYRTVTKTQTVTRFVDVQQPRTVTKYRTVYEDVDVVKKDTLWNMMTGKTQYYFPAAVTL